MEPEDEIELEYIGSRLAGTSLRYLSAVEAFEEDEDSFFERMVDKTKECLWFNPRATGSDSYAGPQGCGASQSRRRISPNNFGGVHTWG